MTRSYRFRLALAFAAFHWALLILVQSEGFLFYLLPGRDQAAVIAGFFFTLLWLQSENLLFAGLVGGLAFLAGRWRLTRGLSFLGYAVISVYVVSNQLYFKIFFDHFRLSLTEGVQTLNLGMAFSSIQQQLDAPFYINAALVAAGLGALGWRYLWRSPAGEAPPWPRWGRTVAVPSVTILFVSGLPSVPSSKFQNLQHHPLSALVQEAFLGPPLEPLARAAARTALPLVYQPEGTRSVDPRLPVAAAAIRAKSPRPNVLLIVLESVGSRQFLGLAGRPSAADTPHLAELAHQAVLFNALYSVFPATVRTHVALNTGGRHLTDDSVYETLVCEFEGPTLARAFNQAGYRTAAITSARLDCEAMGQFYRRAGYQTLYSFEGDPASRRRENSLNSWGGFEERAIDRIDDWLDLTAQTGAPFFLNYMTVATHHPYGVRPGCPCPHTGDDLRARYLNALHYTDAVIGRLLESLRRRGLLADTLVVVTGDHGEAFGDWHRFNFTHRNYLYEENVRSFLLLAHPAIAGPLRSDRCGTSGDIFPTIAALAGLPAPDVPGKNLLSLELEPRFLCFHKCAFPEQWGLRDGPWKFIQTIRNGKAELYDLAHDPTEQHDLAPGQAARINRYQAICRDWFCRTNDEFAARLKDFRSIGDRDIRPEEWAVAGSKVLAVGYMSDKEGGQFVERTTLEASRRPVAWTRWVSYPQDRRILYEWRAPSGQVHSAWVVVAAQWFKTYAPYPGPTPLESGVWQVTLSDGRKTLLTQQFTVTAEGP